MKVELPCPEVEPFHRNVERYAQNVEHPTLFANSPRNVEYFEMKVELPCPEVDPFHRNVERYARKVEHSYFIRQFTGECRTTKTPILLKKMGASLHLNIRLL